MAQRGRGPADLYFKVKLEIGRHCHPRREETGSGPDPDYAGGNRNRKESVLWSEKVETFLGMNILTPSFEGDRILASSEFHAHKINQAFGDWFFIRIILRLHYLRSVPFLA